MSSPPNESFNQSKTFIAKQGKQQNRISQMKLCTTFCLSVCVVVALALACASAYTPPQLGILRLGGRQPIITEKKSAWLYNYNAAFIPVPPPPFDLSFCGCSCHWVTLILLSLGTWPSPSSSNTGPTLSRPALQCVCKTWLRTQRTSMK